MPAHIFVDEVIHPKFFDVWIGWSSFFGLDK
jgi:hypothetical protein